MLTRLMPICGTVLTVLLALSLPTAVWAKQIVIVASGTEAPYLSAAAAAGKNLTQQGHTVETVQLADVAKNVEAFMNRKADVYLAVGTKAAILLHKQVKSPAQLVYCLVAGPEAAGLTQDEPTWGVKTDVPQEQQFKLIQRALPKARKVGLLYRSDVQSSIASLRAAQQALPDGLELVTVAVDKNKSVAEAIDALLDQKVDLVWTTADATVYDLSTIRALLLASLRKQTPVFGFSVAFVKAGALLGVGVDARKQGEQAASLILRQMKSPSTVGLVESPEFQIVLNVIVAERISVELPSDLVSEAAMVFRPGAAQTDKADKP